MVLNLAKIKFRVTEQTTIADAESKLLELKEDGGNEIDFDIIKRIAEFLDAEYLKGDDRGKGSQERFRHEGLNGHPNWQGGIFGVHLAHRKKNKVYSKNFKKYILPALEAIIALKKSEVRSEPQKKES